MTLMTHTKTTDQSRVIEDRTRGSMTLRETLRRDTTTRDTEDGAARSHGLRDTTPCQKFRWDRGSGQIHNIFLVVVFCLPV